MSAATFSHPVRVYYEDTDAAGVVYYANYLRFMERARTEWLAHLGHPLAELEAAEGVVFVVTHVDAHFRRPARLGDLLAVGVQPVEHRGARLVARQDIVRDGVALVEATVTLACVDRARLQPARIPPTLLRSFA